MTPTRYLAALAAAAALLFMLGGLHGVEAGPADTDCAVAQTAFGDCTGYVAGVEDKLSPRCCRGLADIRDMAPTFDRRRALCACIHKEMLAAGKVVTRRAATLSARCGVRISFLPTAHAFDCYRYVPRENMRAPNFVHARCFNNRVRNLFSKR
uniref:Bifunctional inhibitor/plant lipid transfer protein/seed storage helical domain-containing protein n=1 Tax=Triticum aestivum TaxID=4565 RepID=A0A3B6TDV6_WHEAT